MVHYKIHIIYILRYIGAEALYIYKCKRKPLLQLFIHNKSGTEGQRKS